MKQTYNKEAFRSLITLSIPTVLEEVLSTLLQYVDTAMVGHLGEKATAAVSTTTTIGWLIHSIPSAIAVVHRNRIERVTLTLLPAEPSNEKDEA